MPLTYYRCDCCGADDEHFYRSSETPAATFECRSVQFGEPTYRDIPHEVVQPDGSVIVEIEKVEVASEMTVCPGVMRQRQTYPGEVVQLNARRFEPLVIYERANYDSYTPDQKRQLRKYYVPGRNNELTEPGMKRIEITNMSEYNRVCREINAHEIRVMTDHRSMHEEYWKARRVALRDHVNARIRHNPLLVAAARAVRRRSDRKFIDRYGKHLDAHFHAQLLEFNQGNIQDFCAEDTGWKARRAK
jgi:hypothetical protein